jgi:positive regulator of sigma E activity
MEGHCKKRPAPFVIECRGDPVPAPGQTVETGISPGALAGETLCGILFPLAGFIAGFFLLRLLFPRAGEGARAAAGVLCLFSGGLVLCLIRRRFPSKTLPRIIRIIEDCRSGAEEDGPAPVEGPGDLRHTTCPQQAHRLSPPQIPPGETRSVLSTLPVSRNPGILETGT